MATAIWGAGFMGTRWTMDIYSPVWSHSLRFIFAGLIISPFVFINMKKVNWKTATILSVLLFIGLILQTYGIKYTTLAKSGFITTFYALFTPVILGLYLKKKFTKGYWSLVGVALFGMALLCELQWSGFNIGDAYTLASALFFSLHIIAVDVLAKDEPPILINFVQCFIMGIIGLTYGIIAEGLPDITYIIPTHENFNSLVFYGFIILSVFSSLVAFSIQMIAQKDIPPHVVSLVFLMESIFASILGYFAFDESLSVKAMIGAFFILASVACLKPMMDRNSLRAT
jgi:drug/metabolite transporter (DMT)-like permease